jgi:hypothetical protein
MPNPTIISFKRCFSLLYCITLGIIAIPQSLYAQIDILPGAYKSNRAMGDWQDPDSWLSWDGSSWVLPSIPPYKQNDVFILKGHEIRLTDNEEVKNLYLYGNAEPGKKLNLENHELYIFGSLNSFQIIDDEFFKRNGTSPIADWIYPETGSIVFRGNSRTVVDRNSWSAQTNLSRFQVIFDPDPGETLTVNAAIKANYFEIRSGTVIQTVSSNGTFRSSTFSFNIHDSFGTHDFGEFIIRTGATLISEATHPHHQILRRTENRPASSFILEPGAKLELRGAAPELDAMDVQLLGEVTYSGSGPTQLALASTFSQSLPIHQYHHLNLQTNGVFTPPETLQVSGDLTVSATYVDNAVSKLTLNGEYDQQISAQGVTWKDLAIDNSFGQVTFQSDLLVERDFEMINGNLDFMGNQLHINLNGEGNYSFNAGSWQNLSRLYYMHTPELLEHSNGSFPFFDHFLGEPRMLKLLGDASSGSSGFSIAYHQSEGVNHNAQFSDNDGTPILYHLNSYFEIQGFQDQSGTAEIWVQASDMILDDISDLRIASIGAAAEGYHLDASVEMGEIWGKRQVDLTALGGNTFTLSSIGEFSVLPLIWESFQLSFHEDTAVLQWETKSEPSTVFYIFRSNDGHHFLLCDSLVSNLYSEQRTFTYIDHSANKWQPVSYYKIMAITMDGKVSESPIYRLNGHPSVKKSASIFPNPYESGKLNLMLPFSYEVITLAVIDNLGRIALNWIGEARQLDLEKLASLPTGNYVLIISGSEERVVLRWIKRTGF